MILGRRICVDSNTASDMKYLKERVFIKKKFKYIPVDIHVLFVFSSERLHTVFMVLTANKFLF